MLELSAAVIVPSAEKPVHSATREQYVDRCRLIVDIAKNITSSESPKADFDHLQSIWHGFVPQFDDPRVWATMNALSAVGSLVSSEQPLSASIEGCREFLAAFRAQRRDLLSENCDYLLRLYRDFGDDSAAPDLKQEIEKVFMDDILQMPRGETRGRSIDFLKDKDKKPVAIKDSLRGGYSSLILEDLELKKRYFEHGTPGTRQNAIWDIAEASLTMNSPVQQEAAAYVSEQIKSFGLDEATLFRAWKRTGFEESERPREKRQKFVARNIATMFKLESAAPGICKTLFDEFGICDFERYPAEVLLAQYENRNKDMPYGIAIYAQEDYNGALNSKNGQPTETLFRDLKGLEYGLRIYEARTRSDVLKILAKSHNHYGGENKISFALISAHGRENSIHFGQEEGGVEREGTVAFSQRELERVFRKDSWSWARRRHQGGYNRWWTQKLRAMFVKNPTIILNSCSTGVKGGIRDNLVEIGAKVFAPEQEAKLLSIKVTKNRFGRLIFSEAEYFYPKDKNGPRIITLSANPHARKPLLRRFFGR